MIGSTEIQVGALLNERYRLDAELGQGGMGVIYRAHDTLLDRDVAIKVLSATSLDAERRARLLHEAQASAKLNHPNIVSVHDAGEADGVPFAVMELVEGDSLHERRPQALEDILLIAQQVCAALEHAHAHGIIHRDLKPENVLITPDGSVKLTDFGLARIATSRLTTEETLVGTVFYSAPEQALGQEVDYRADLYALGVILYELTTGQLPYTADDPLVVISQHVHAPVVPPSTHNAAILPALDALIVQLLSKQPQDRPASATEVRQVLDDLAPATQATSATGWLQPKSETWPPSLLQTKLNVPPVRPELVPRPRLIERLNAGFHCKLTLISAPAGFGKTTLLSEWAMGCGRPVAWLSLDGGDNDPVRFWAYFIAALQREQAEIGKAALMMLQSPQPPAAEVFLTGLINEITAADPAPFALVLDDYHLIKAQPIHNALAFLLDHMPSQMNLVIATRADPPLHIARLRGRGQLAELRLTDLRFTPDEATRFLNQAMNLSLSIDDVTALASRTEGWIAGLQMAAVSMQGREDTASFVHAFTGSDRHILDYLVEEVLQRQPDHIQTFLLQTAILERLTGFLCDAITGQADGQATLEMLERANLFTVPLDNERRWYRYHRLFADLLQRRLRQAQPDRVPILHRRASEWYEQNGFLDAAINHALSAEDLERAAHLIEQAAEATLMRSEVATLLRWVDALPDEMVRARPTLCLFHAWALLLGGRPINIVESRLQSIDGDADLVSKASALRAFVAIFQGQLSRAAQLSREALDQLAEDDVFLRGIATWMSAFFDMVDGDIVGSTQALDRIATASQEAGNVMIAVMTTCSLAELHLTRGQLGKAREIYQRALELATDERGQRLPIAGMALIGLGEIWREQNDLEAADRYLSEGIEQIKRWGEIGALDGYISLAYVRQARGDLDGTRDAIQKAQQLAVKFDATKMDDDLVAAHRASLWVMQGEVELSLHWLEGQKLTVDAVLVELEERHSSGIRSDPGRRRRTAEYVALARLLIARGRHNEALAVLELLMKVAEKHGLNGRVIKFQVLKAIAYQAQGDLAQALATLERALSLAKLEGYVRIFVDEGEPMRALLRQAAARGIAAEYVGRLLAAFDGDVEEASPYADTQPLIEPLSERELEVLRLLTTHLSSTEIAEELYISVHTVRYHIKSIYSKLGAHRRADAVDQARELKLL
jgi:LuxR family maltose regulon positive regulatory protein